MGAGWRSGAQDGALGAGIVRILWSRLPEPEQPIDGQRHGHALEVVVQWLSERRVEMGFVTLPDNRFHTITLGEDEYVAVLPATHALAARGVTPTATLDGLPFIMMQEGAHRNIEPLLERAGARPRVRYRFTQVISILGVVQQGLGVSIAPRLALPDQFPGVVYRPLEPRAPRRVALAMRDITELSPVARAFVELAERWAKRRRPSR